MWKNSFITSLTLLIFVFFVGVINVNADVNNGKLSISLNELKGEMLSGKQKGEKNPNINILNIFYEEDELNGTIELNDGAKINFNGVFYPLKGESYYGENLIVADLKNSYNDKQDYNVIDIKVEKINEENANLILITEEAKHGDLWKFEKKIELDLFNSLKEKADTYVNSLNISERELQEKVAPLLIINNKTKHSTTSPFELNGTFGANSILSSNNSVTYSSGFEAQDKSVQTELPVNMSQLLKLIDDLKSNPTANLDDYSLPESLFKQPGQKSYNSSVLSGDHYVAYALDNNQSTLIQLTTFSTSGQLNADSQTADLGLTLTNGILVEYVHATKQINVLYYDLGLAFRDMELGVGKINDKNVFVAQTLSGSNLYERGSSNTGSILASLIPFSNTVSSIWDFLNPIEGSSDLGQRVRFLGNDYDDQMDRHGGKVYRNATGLLDKHDMRVPGANANILSEFSVGTQNISVQIGYRFNILTNLQ